MELKFKKLDYTIKVSEDKEETFKSEGVIPNKAHRTDAGFDLTATRLTQEMDKSGKLVLVYHTDIAVEIPEGYVGLMFMRSSVAATSLVMTNCVGVIDAGYRGEIMGKFKITTDTLPTVYQPGDKFAQLVIVPCPMFEAVEVETEELAESDRGDNGYGSTDKASKPEVASETPCDECGMPDEECENCENGTWGKQDGTEA